MNIFTKSVKGSKRINQDRYFAYENKENKIKILGIFDGHGTYGHYIAEYAVTFFKNVFDKNIDKFVNFINNEARLSWLKKLYPLVQQYIKNKLLEYSRENYLNWKEVDNILLDKNDKPIKGGTTCSIVIIYNKKIYVTNVGDSDIYVYNKNSFDKLNISHKANNINEFIRIQEMKLELPFKFIYDQRHVYDKQTCPEVFLYDKDQIIKNPIIINPWKNKLYPMNINFTPASYCVSPLYPTNRFYSCIAMTRGLGNFHMSKYGYSNEPDGQIYNLNEDDIILVGTDGVWDNWTDIEIIDFISENMDDINSLGNNFITKTNEKNIRNFGWNKDDTTILMTDSYF